jgi:O-antigen/teichoic acid export membrane protein
MQNGVDADPVAEGLAVQARTWLIGKLTGSKSGIKDVAVSMVPQGVSLCTGILTSVLLARGLGPAGLGEFALVLSVSDMAVTLSDLGIGQTAIRYATRSAQLGDSEGHFAFLRWAFARRMFLMALISIAAYLVAPVVASGLWHIANLAPWLRLGLLIGVFGALAHVPSIYFQSLRRFNVNASILTGQALISFLGILLLALLRHWSVESVIFVSVMTAACGALAFLIVVPRAALFAEVRISRGSWALTDRSWRGPELRATQYDKNELDHPDTFARYMLFSSLFVLLTMKADVWLMGYFLNAKSVGVYNVATRLTIPLATLLAAINTALWPRASGLVRIEDKISLLRRTFRKCSLAALAGLVYSAVAPLLVPLLFGARYASSVFLGQLLCGRYLLAILTCPIGLVGYSLGLVRAYWFVNLVQLIVVVTTNVVLLPRVGAVGSALALIANEVVGLAAMGMLVWSILTRRINR